MWDCLFAIKWWFSAICRSTVLLKLRRKKFRLSYSEAAINFSGFIYWFYAVFKSWLLLTNYILLDSYSLRSSRLMTVYKMRVQDESTRAHTIPPGRIHWWPEMPGCVWAGPSTENPGPRAEQSRAPKQIKACEKSSLLYPQSSMIVRWNNVDNM